MKAYQFLPYHPNFLFEERLYKPYSRSVTKQNVSSEKHSKVVGSPTKNMRNEPEITDDEEVLLPPVKTPNRRSEHEKDLFSKS